MPNSTRTAGQWPKLDGKDLDLLEMMSRGVEAGQLKQALDLTDLELELRVQAIKRKFDCGNLSLIISNYIDIRDYSRSRSLFSAKKFDASVQTLQTQTVLDRNRYFLIRTNIVAIAIASLLIGFSFSAIMIFVARSIL